ncbi:deoxyhypusine synthase [Desulfothermus naphthae]
MQNEFVRDINAYLDPDKAGLIPLEPLDPDKIRNFDELLLAMSKTAFGGRQLGEALDVLETMVRDSECHVVATFSGAMTVAKMGKLICKMIDEGWVQSIISTGALMAHGFIEAIGMKHYKYQFGEMDDKELCRAGLNRVYDTLEPEKNFIHSETVVREVFKRLKEKKYLCSYLICRELGRYLHENYKDSGILKSAYEKDVPVYIPAFTDSELALSIACNFLAENPSLAEKFDPEKLPFVFNPYMDLFHYTKRISNAKKIGIFTIGGGVPRNWAQQVGPFLEMSLQQFPELKWKIKRFHYGVRICPEPVHWGGLSGCTYEEGISWGKFVPKDKGGKFAEVLCDATIAWPILILALDRRLKKDKKGDKNG